MIWDATIRSSRQSASRECWRIARDLKYKMPDTNMEPLKYVVLLDRMRRAKVDRPTLGKAVAIKAMQAQSYASLDSALDEWRVPRRSEVG